VELRKEFLPEYVRSNEAEYYQIWAEDGRVLERSPNLDSKNLPRRTGPVDSPILWNLVMPDGRDGRAVGISIFPHIDEDELPMIKARLRAEIVLVKDRAEIYSILYARLAVSLAVVIMVVIGIIIVVPRIINSGLRPLNRFADHTARIDSRTLGARYPASGIPDELRPIAGQLNALLERLDRSFAREKRLTADMAHELKTPAAELRSMAEVALRWPDDRKFSDDALRHALEIAKQMDRRVSVLLALGRCEAGMQTVSPAPVDVKSTILEVWEPWKRLAEARAIRAEFDLQEAAPVVTDAEMLSSILTNLFENVVEYCTEGGRFICRLESRANGLRLSLTNSNSSLTEEDLPHLFEHLWRKDQARSDSNHSGLGLVIVDAFARILGIDIRAALIGPGYLVMTLDIPQGIPQMA
jgi:two-component system sensor histidine kinase QseC